MPLEYRTAGLFEKWTNGHHLFFVCTCQIFQFEYVLFVLVCEIHFWVSCLITPYESVVIHFVRGDLLSWGIKVKNKNFYSFWIKVSQRLSQQFICPFKSIFLCWTFYVLYFSQLYTISLCICSLLQLTHTCNGMNGQLPLARLKFVVPV